VTIQEMPERAPTGQLPRSIQVILDNDLVDKIKPGDRVQVNGVLRCFGMSQASGSLQTRIIGTGIQNILADKEKPIMSEQDIKNIRKIAKEEKLFELLGNSIAGSIEGHL
jgi:DNA replication licensing factor MCM3